MILRMTFPSRRNRRRRWACSTGRTMSMGARAERMLASRLVELERKLDTAEAQEAAETWQEYYVVLDLWLRVRAPMPSGAPITQAMLDERFRGPRKEKV